MFGYIKISFNFAAILVEKAIETEIPANQATTSTPVPTPTQTTAQMQSQRAKRPYYTRDELVARMQIEDPTLYRRYQSGKRLVVVGGGLLVAGGVMLGISALSYRSGEPSDFTFIFEWGGLICVPASIPVMIIGGSRKRKTVNIYHRKYIATQTVPHFQLNMHGNGVGLAYMF